MVAIDAATTARHDEVTPVRLGGIAAEAATLVARIRWRGERFVSSTTFAVPGSGVVDTAEHEPVDGPYDGVEPMGWLWAATPTDGAADDVIGTDVFDGETAIRFEAQVDDETRATAEQRRSVTDSAVEHHSVGTADLAGELFLPDGEGPHPGVVVLHGSGGVPPLGVAGLLAGEGYAAFALRWLDHPTTPTGSLTAVPLSHVDSAAAYLRERPTVRDDVGLWGISKGGELALQVGARRSWPAAVVAVSGSAVAMPGHEPGQPSWADSGEPVPFLSPPAPPADDVPSKPRDRIALMLDAATEDELDRATAPLGAGSPPTLLLAGGADAVWPASRLCTPAADRLEAAGVRVEQRTYADAGHTLLPPFHPTTPETGGTARGNRRGAVEGWRATRSFLDAELGT
mgnify:FL=1